MVTPIEPLDCVNTGRLLTEWFEYPEYTDEQAREINYKKAGVPPDFKWSDLTTCSPEVAAFQRTVMRLASSRKLRKYMHNMTNQEAAMRLNEATKIVSPENFKFLDAATSERTGLEINPLWQMEVLVRSGVLAPKEQVAALKELASYTHSKAPTVNRNLNSEVSPEDWLLELASDQYKVIDEVNPTALVGRVIQPRELGLNPAHAKRRAKKVAELLTAGELGQEKLKAIEESVDLTEDFDWELDD